jgi:hypothetical protein
VVFLHELSQVALALLAVYETFWCTEHWTCDGPLGFLFISSGWLLLSCSTNSLWHTDRNKNRRQLWLQCYLLTFVSMCVVSCQSVHPYMCTVFWFRFQSLRTLKKIISYLFAILLFYLTFFFGRSSWIQDLVLTRQALNYWSYPKSKFSLGWSQVTILLPPPPKEKELHMCTIMPG